MKRSNAVSTVLARMANALATIVTLVATVKSLITAVTKIAAGKAAAILTLDSAFVMNVIPVLTVRSGILAVESIAELMAGAPTAFVNAKTIVGTVTNVINKTNAATLNVETTVFATLTTECACVILVGMVLDVTN
jgi:hypothetical protein